MKALSIVPYGATPIGLHSFHFRQRRTSVKPCASNFKSTSVIIPNAGSNTLLMIFFLYLLILAALAGKRIIEDNTQYQIIYRSYIRALSFPDRGNIRGPKHENFKRILKKKSDYVFFCLE